MNISGFHNTAARKKQAKEETESGSDYEEVPEHQGPKWKTRTLPAKLPPTSPSTNMLLPTKVAQSNMKYSTIRVQNNSKSILLLKHCKADSLVCFQSTHCTVYDAKLLFI